MTLKVNERWRQYYWNDENGNIIRRTIRFTSVTEIWVSNTSHTVIWHDDLGGRWTTVVAGASTACVDFVGEAVK